MATATAAHIARVRDSFRRGKVAGRGVGDRTSMTDTVRMAALTSDGMAPAGLRTSAGDVERFFIEEGLNIPPRELAARFAVFMRGRRPINTNTMLDRAVRAAIAHPNNTDNMILAVLDMTRRGQIPREVGAAVVEWMTLLRSGKFE